MICTLLCDLDEMPNMWVSGKNHEKGEILCYDMISFEYIAKCSKYVVGSLNAMWYVILEMHEDNCMLCGIL